MEKSQEGSSGPRIIQWLLDTRILWPVRQTASPKEAVQELKTMVGHGYTYLEDWMLMNTGLESIVAPLRIRTSFGAEILPR